MVKRVTWIAAALVHNTAGLGREWVGVLCAVKKQEQEMGCGCFAAKTATVACPAIAGVGVVELAAGRNKGKVTGVRSGRADGH